MTYVAVGFTARLAARSIALPLVHNDGGGQSGKRARESDEDGAELHLE
jgi:hypothetical protein